MGNFGAVDGTLLIWIQDTFVNSAWTPFWKTITSLGNGGMIWIAVTVILLFFKKTRRAGIASALALLGSLLVNNLILKDLIARTRPYDAVEGVRLLIERQSDYSFPSGHTGSSFSSASAIFFNLPKRYGIAALVLASLIAFSRLYVGVHYPSDVAAGILIGFALGWMGTGAARKVMPEKLKDR